MQDGPHDWEPVITRPDPMTEEEREAWLDALDALDEPFDPEDYPDQHGPPGGYGTWTLRTGENRPDFIVALDPITTGNCDHRFQAKGHDPGIKLRHLAHQIATERSKDVSVELVRITIDIGFP